jgi:hypothetical protein
MELDDTVLVVYEVAPLQINEERESIEGKEDGDEVSVTPAAFTFPPWYRY